MIFWLWCESPSCFNIPAADVCVTDVCLCAHTCALPGVWWLTVIAEHLPAVTYSWLDLSELTAHSKQPPPPLTGISEIRCVSRHLPPSPLTVTQPKYTYQCSVVVIFEGLVFHLSVYPLIVSLIGHKICAVEAKRFYCIVSSVSPSCFHYSPDH